MISSPTVIYYKNIIHYILILNLKYYGLININSIIYLDLVRLRECYVQPDISGILWLYGIIVHVYV